MKLLNKWFLTQMMMSGGGGAETRYFIELDPVLNSRYTLVSPIDFTDDFEVKCEFSTTDTAVMVLVGRSDSNSDFVAVNSPTPGKLTTRMAGIDIVFDYPSLNDGKLYELSARREGLLVTASSSGDLLTLESGVTDGATVTYNQLGALFTSSFFNGIQANTKFTDNSGAPVTTTFKLDEPTGNTELSLEGNNTLTYVNIPESNRELYTLDGATWISNDIWGGVNLSSANNCVVTTIVSGSQWDLTSPDGAPTNFNNAGAANPFVGLVAGATYTFSFDSDKPVNIRVFNGAFGVIDQEEDTTSITFVAEDSNRLYIGPRDSTVTRISNATIVRLIEIA